MAYLKTILTLLYSILINAATALHPVSLSDFPAKTRQCLSSALQNSSCLIFHQTPTSHNFNACLCTNTSDFIASTASCLRASAIHLANIEAVWNKLVVAYETTHTSIQYSVRTFLRQSIDSKCEQERKNEKSAEAAVFHWAKVPKYAVYLGIGMGCVGFAMYFVIRLVEGGSFTKWSNAWRGRVRRVYRWAEWHGD